MSVLCPVCGYENPDGTTVCEICMTSLGNNAKSAAPAQPAQAPAPAPVPAPAQPAAPASNGREYYVMCPESSTKTTVQSGSVTSFFCKGCNKTHEIDNFLWSIEVRELEPAPAAEGGNTCCTQTSCTPKGDNLWLEELTSHTRIDIDKEGGILGRYGKYGAAFFTSRGLNMVSGEHCSFSYEYGTWVIRHLSRTNDTDYNNMKLDREQPYVLEDGKLLTLARAITFVVRIG